MTNGISLDDKELKKITHKDAVKVGNIVTVVVDGQPEWHQKLIFDHATRGRVSVLVRRTKSLGTVKVTAWVTPGLTDPGSILSTLHDRTATRADHINTFDPIDMVDNMWVAYDHPSEITLVK